MRKKSYYNEILDQYLLGEDSFKDSRKSLEYSDGDGYYSMGDSYTSIVTLLLWGEQPSESMLKEAKYLTIEPPEECLEMGRLPGFVGDFQELIALDIPLIYALSLHNDSLPHSVENLTLINDRNQTDNLGNSKKEIKANLLFPNFCYPNIKSLNLFTSSTSSLDVDGHININESNFPNLEFLRCRLSDKDKYPLLDNFTNLKHLWVSLKKCDLFSHIKCPLQSLNIDGSGTKLNIQEIQKVPSLEVLRINSCYSIINCEDLLKMPKLREVNILNSKQIKNIEALLNMPSLTSLEILDCKGAFTKEQKRLFHDNMDKFELLSIDYA